MRKVVWADDEITTSYLEVDEAESFAILHCTVHLLTPSTYKYMRDEVKKIYDKYPIVYAQSPSHHFVESMGFVKMKDMENGIAMYRLDRSEG